MDAPGGHSIAAQDIARALIDGFNRHYRLFRECSRQAKDRFEAGEWLAVQQAVRDRIQFYDDRVRETVSRLHSEFHAESIDDAVWKQAKLYYIDLLIEHKQPELAETFFNSVFCKILHRTYFHNDFIFVRPAISTEYIESDPPAFRCYYPNQVGLRRVVGAILLDFGWRRPYQDLERDVAYVCRAVDGHLGRWPSRELDFQIQVLSSAFYRNKAAYIIGKAINGGIEYPFAVPVLHTSSGELFLDTILLDDRCIGTLFSLSRAYFMVDMEVPSAYVQFLRSIVPGKPRSELYSMLGLGKQGKALFFRDLIFHLHHSRDDFVIAPGIPGLVMLVFTLPSYPYVFKLIKDVFGASKDIDRETVKRKYQLVKQVDRVGRMADTLEFSYAALPKARFSPELLGQLYQQAPSLLEEDGDDLVIKHLYIERRMEPLNLYLNRAERENNQDLIEHAVSEYGNAIRELAIANIFPGDMLWKNFGITRFGRVVFYDYDEIEHMSDCRFRTIPPAPNPEMEMSGEAWYSVSRNDVFPEEFATFLLTSPRVRKSFMEHHADLLEISFWRETQAAIGRGEVKDFFPYPDSVRFGHTSGQDDDQFGLGKTA
ncbi:MAG TPA: bifunctional isocitrate dehydrogenase kinase/phosphatase [Rhodocyclaceae bacterium]|nr:bifunctional isocitrate dehydrogenase kinase/phosphatase [Rhodocyclaceae bacterium]